MPVALKGLGITTFKLQLQRYLELSIQRNELEEMAESLLSERTDYQRLRTLPGVGPIISLMIIAESGDPRRLPTIVSI